MKILRTIVLKDLKFNKKRTVGTIVGVVLSCALIVVIFGMFVSLYNSLLENEIRYGGYYHLKINNVNEDRIKELKDNERIKDVISIRNAGYLESEIANDYFVSEDLYSMDKDTFDLMKYKIEKGRFPENSEEVLISNSIKYMLNIDIGDYIDVKINENEVKAKVVGLSNRYGEIITTGVQNGDYNAYIVLKNPSSFKKDIINIIGDGTIKFNEIYHGDFEINLNILRWEVFDLSDEVSSFFVRILTIIVIIIVVTSVFSIRNSFAIST